MEFTKEQMKAALRKLPSDIQDAVTAVEKTEALIAIEQKYKLHVDKAGDLAKQVDLVLLGLVHPSKFIENIKTKVGVSDTDARGVAQDVNEKIFRPVRESLKKLHGITDDSMTGSSSPSPVQPVSSTPQSIPKFPPVVPTPSTPKPLPPNLSTPLASSIAATSAAPAFNPRIIPPIAPTPAAPVIPQANPSKEPLSKPAPQLPQVEPPKQSWSQYAAPTQNPVAPSANEIGKLVPPIPLTEEEPLEKREKVLQEIEHPTPAPVITDTPHDKLSGTVQLNRQEIDVSNKIGSPEKPTETKPEPPKYKTDPYREPIE